MIDCFQTEKKSTLTNWKKRLSTPSTSPNFPLTLPCLTEKKSRIFFLEGEGGRSEGGREEVESPFMDPGQLLPHVHLSDWLTHTAITSQVTHMACEIFKSTIDMNWEMLACVCWKWSNEVAWLHPAMYVDNLKSLHGFSYNCHADDTQLFKHSRRMQ